MKWEFLKGEHSNLPLIMLRIHVFMSAGDRPWAIKSQNHTKSYWVFLQSNVSSAHFFSQLHSNCHNLGFNFCLGDCSNLTGLPADLLLLSPHFLPQVVEGFPFTIWKGPKFSTQFIKPVTIYISNLISPWELWDWD